MLNTITVSRDDLIAVMALASLVQPAPGDNNTATAAWMRCWEAMATSPKDAIALHDRITAIVKEIKMKKVEA